jgi:nitrilase
MIDRQSVLEERRNFDPSDHYSRPDVTKLEVNRKCQKIVELSD